MTKNELIEKLQAIEGNPQVLQLNTDGPSNLVSRVSSVDAAWYDPEYGEVVDECDAKDDPDFDNTGMVRAIVLWP